MPKNKPALKVCFIYYVLFIFIYYVLLPEQWSSSEGGELTIYLLDPFIKGYVWDMEDYF